MENPIRDIEKMTNQTCMLLRRIFSPNRPVSTISVSAHAQIKTDAGTEKKAEFAEKTADN